MDRAADRHVTHFDDSRQRHANEVDAVEPQFILLGHIAAISADGTQITSPSVKRRALLAALLLQPGTFQSVRLLEEFLWDDPPMSAMANLRSHLTGLRAELDQSSSTIGADLQTSTGGGGYRLVVPRAVVDVHQFTAGVCEGRRLLSRGDTTAAITVLERCLSLWRAPFASCVPPTRRISAHADGLINVHLDASQDLYAAYILTGGTALLSYRIERALIDGPYRERLWELLVAVHYLNGDVGSALDKIEQCRSLFADELGLDLPRGVGQLQRSLLTRDDGGLHDVVRTFIRSQ